MSPTTARRVASAVFAVVFILWLAALVLEWLTRNVSRGSTVGDPNVDFLLTMVSGVMLLLFPLAGLLIATRRPDNAIGWLLLAIGIGWSLLAGAVAWADYGLKLHPGSLPGADAGAALGGALWAPPLGMGAVFLLLLFPDGRLPSRRWRSVAVTGGVAIAAITLAIVLSPGKVDPGQFPGVREPSRHRCAAAGARHPPVRDHPPRGVHGRCRGQPGRQVPPLPERRSGSRSNGWPQPRP